MGRLKSQLATRLLKLRIDEIEVKIKIASTGSDGKFVNKSVRLVASSKVNGSTLLLSLNLPTLLPALPANTALLAKIRTCSSLIRTLRPTPFTVQTKRAIARRVGSTYAYDFLGLMEVGLIGEWEKYLTEQGMVAWLVKMKTPEYPEDREVVVIAN
jgi:acetyl-CoA carboxylase/biotin carboxylase 1